MSALTIKGQVFEVTDAEGIAVGTPMTEGHVSALQQTRRENIRNNMARAIEKELGDAEALTDEQHGKMQELVNEYAAKYEFGVRAAGSPRVVDPVEKEARREIGEIIKQRFYALKGERLKGEPLNEAIDQVLASPKGDKYRSDARRALRDRERAGEELLSQSGLAA